MSLSFGRKDFVIATKHGDSRARPAAQMLTPYLRGTPPYVAAIDNI